MMRVHHVAFRTADLPALVRFYAEVLGLAVVRRREGSVWLRMGNAILMLEASTPGEPPIGTGTRELLAFAVDETEKRALLDKLGVEGIPIEDRTEHTSYFRDPDGRRVAVSTHPLA